MGAWLQRVKSRKVPIAGGFELTQRCNLRCVHCYLGEQDEIRQRRNEELTTGQWCRIIDQAASAGTLWLLLTGGEPLLRKDFATIYTHAKRRGLLVTVFSNGTLLNQETLDLFRRLPPFRVEISLYGASAATYERITGVQGAHERCLSGIRRLAAMGVRLNLKTVLMTHNAQELADIERLGAQYGERFRFDPEIQPRMTGDRAPLRLRLSPKEAVAKEFADPARKQDWLVYREKRSAQKPASPKQLYGCSAGTSNFFVNAYGRMQPCLMVRDIRCDLRSGHFDDAWAAIGAAIAARGAPRDFACGVCEHRMVCSACPAFANMEAGSDEIPSPYQCAMTHERAFQVSPPGSHIGGQPDE